MDTLDMLGDMFDKVKLFEGHLLEVFTKDIFEASHVLYQHILVFHSSRHDMVPSDVSQYAGFYLYGFDIFL